MGKDINCPKVLGVWSDGVAEVEDVSEFVDCITAPVLESGGVGVLVNSTLPVPLVPLVPARLALSPDRRPPRFSISIAGEEFARPSRPSSTSRTRLSDGTDRVVLRRTRVALRFRRMPVTEVVNPAMALAEAWPASTIPAKEEDRCRRGIRSPRSVAL